MITLMDQLVIAVEDKDGQAGGAAVLFNYLLNPLKGLSDELGRLNNPYPCCSASIARGWAAAGRNL